MAGDDSGQEAGAPARRLREAIKQVVIVRDDIPRLRPDQDSALARAEYWLRGVADELEEDDDDAPDEIDPSLVTDGGDDSLAHLDYRVRQLEDRVDELESQLDVLTDDFLERLRRIDANTDLLTEAAAERGDVDPAEVDALREGGDG